MDANHIQEESKELVKKLNSLERADFDFAINQYFESNAVFDNGHVKVQGASKIKKLLSLGPYIRTANGEVSAQPVYDAKHQILYFSASPTYAIPMIPTKWFMGRQTFNMRVHLASNQDDQGDGGVKGQKLYVTKWVAKKQNPDVIDKALSFYPVRFFLTLLSLTVASSLGFWQAHKHDGFSNFVLAALIEVVNSVWGILLAETGRRQAQAENWRAEKLPQVKQYSKQIYDQAWDTATKVQADIETRAKSAGIPVDDYKRQASAAVVDLAENLEARAKAAGLPVDEYKKQAETIIEQLRAKAEEMAKYVDGKADEAKTQVDETVQDAKKNIDLEHPVKGKGAEKNKHAQNNGDHHAPQQNNPPQQNNETVIDRDQKAKEIQAEFAQTPHTPLGGHDPTAPNAPSFADAAKL